MHLQDKIALIQFNTDHALQHIMVDNQATCRDCKEKQCLNICPTGVFNWDYQPGSPILVAYEQCVECGACRLACPFGNIHFTYPSGGMGVAYHEG